MKETTTRKKRETKKEQADRILRILAALDQTARSGTAALI